ncbi:MAG: hypothetical protein LDL19_01410 [Thiobacillus sp.]|nr:hypothetical protein [Thiobacillus sp.]
MKRRLAQSCLLAAILVAGAAWAQGPGTPVEPDWRALRRDVDAGASRPGGNGDFAARREAIRERARARFAEADRSGDGFLSRDELAQLRPMLARHFDRIDTNQDGLVSEQELADALRRLRERRREHLNQPDRWAPVR